VALVFSMQCLCAMLCFRLWHVWLYHICPYYPINGTIFGEKIVDRTMCALIFSINFVWNISRSKKNAEIFCHRLQANSCKVRFSWTSKFIESFWKSTEL
jgi:hypothetical protein